MTDRLKGCWVAFEHDIRVDDAKHLLGAIRMIKGVAEVKSHVSDSDHWFAYSKARRELITKFYEFLEGLDKKKKEED